MEQTIYGLLKETGTWIELASFTQDSMDAAEWMESYGELVGRNVTTSLPGYVYLDLSAFAAIRVD